MTSESEAKTNEFLKRRRLRLQQVREQSKDIAKKLRQRAKVEQLQHIADLDAQKVKDYLHHQNKLVKRLEELYAQGVKNVGKSHDNATKESDGLTSDKVDQSKLRGREAAAELKKKRQEKLNEQKRLLDRKLQAREAANVLSREKSSVIAKKLNAKSLTNLNPEEITVNAVADSTSIKALSPSNKVNKTDMATQWDCEEMPNEWHPAVPALALPKDDKDSVKDSSNVQTKRIDLFALSSEMPSSLRGGFTSNVEERITAKPSMTMVTEYIQNRALRLRETDTSGPSMRQRDDLHCMKQTILRSRSSKIEGTASTSVCHVHDQEVIPIPSWQAESNCEFCCASKTHNCVQIKPLINSQKYKYNGSINGDKYPISVLRHTTPFPRNKVHSEFFHTTEKGNDKSTILNGVESVLPKKNSATMYNHLTMNSHDIPYSNAGLVVRESQERDDAYSQAVRESSTDNVKEQECLRKVQEMRSKVAMTKQSVEKEYNDTMSFLKSIPKEKCSKHTDISHLDERRQRILKDRHQRKLQQEFKKLEKECRNNYKAKNMDPEHRTHYDAICKSKSPSKDLGNELNVKDFEYSWMPVPESDGNLAIHTIPTTIKDGRVGNTVKFSKVDSYHEYRSRHKHTPPTKDTGAGGQSKKKVFETVLIQNDESESMEDSESSSDTSSIENLKLEKKISKKSDETISEAEKIIIYKILNSKSAKKQKEKRKLKLIDDVTKVLTSIHKDQLSTILGNDNNNNKDNKQNEVNNGSHLKNINEGIYEVVNEKGEYFTSQCTDYPQEGDQDSNEEKVKHDRHCMCNKELDRHDCKDTTDVNQHSGNGDVSAKTTPKNANRKCDSDSINKSNRDGDINISQQPSVGTSTSSFKTAATAVKEQGLVADDNYVKLLSDNGQETGKLYIGAGSFLRDEAYEVVIQLRKKEILNKSMGKQPESTVTDRIVESAQEITNPYSRSQQLSGTIPTNKQLNKENSCQDLKHVQNSNLVLDKSEEKDEKADPMKEDDDTGMRLMDKGNCTISQLSFAVPIDSSKLEPVPRPATSTYTQTTFNSPNSRPNFIHMSSSTSTAYMSPPDMMLPKYLRNMSNEKDEVTSHDTVFEKREYRITKHGNHYHDCSCKHCTRHEKVRLNRLKSKCSKHFLTPPNTARNFEDTSNINDEVCIQSTRYAPKKCSKCINRATSIDNTRHIHRKKRKEPSNNWPQRKVILHNSNAFKNYSCNKSKLNPVVKSYVNKLLELNSNGLKAIQIANQECSSVSTPGSSIIEVPRNINKLKMGINNKISLEQIRSTLKEQILREHDKQNEKAYLNSQSNKKSRTCLSKSNKVRKSVHKVKNLNISRKLMKSKKSSKVQYHPSQNVKSNVSTSSPPSTSNGFYKKTTAPTTTKLSNNRNAPIFVSNLEYSNGYTCSDVSVFQNESLSKSLFDKAMENMKINEYEYNKLEKSGGAIKINDYVAPLHKDTTLSPLSDHSKKGTDFPVNTSTQTISQDLDSEINLIKSAEDKLQNMEKIADLTEKCTKRLSNLAKVLEKVRRNKSLIYSHISTSDTASDSDNKSEKNSNEINQSNMCAPGLEIKNISDVKLSNQNEKLAPEFIAFLKDIPKPEEVKYTSKLSSTNTGNGAFENASNINDLFIKPKNRPPPALSRVQLKHEEDIVPHELSTVLEVDSPMSVKQKNQSSNTDILNLVHVSNNEDDIAKQVTNTTKSEFIGNPDLLEYNTNLSKRHSKISKNHYSDDSKVQVMDIKQFNDVMLKPFISLQEYAKQNNVGVLDEGSNVDDNVRDDLINEELSSLHSDGSLPDVIAELLKRNIIAEPFKFDTVSNLNSTSISSESTLSVLALSKVLKEKRKGNLVFRKKDNRSETSDTLSVSSNPDLENAFQKLGMGWASSTLKKTKERLALSSSSNTSSSSLSKFKLKPLNDQDIPVLVTDSVTSMNKTSKKRNNPVDISKNAEQQTSFMNSMTVKEFLTNELSKKITFTNKSYRNDTGEEFMSLLETKIPEEMKQSSRDLLGNHSADSLPSANNNRARTSTPVQLFKSMTYHSSSSSNTSNGLFSNADDLSSVKGTSNSMRNHSTSDKDDLTIPNCSLKVRKNASDGSN